MLRTNTPADVANTGRVKIDSGSGVVLDVPVTPIIPYSSGLRNMASFLNSGFTAFEVRLLRNGPVVTVHIVNLAYSGSSTGTVSVMDLPDGFGPPSTAASYTTRGQLAIVTSSGVVQIANPTASVTSVTFTYQTLETPPPNPPGSNP